MRSSFLFGLYVQAKAEFTAGVKQKRASAGISLAFWRNNIYNRNGMKKLLLLFWEFFKIGLFTFGGGYAMVAVIERTLVEKKKWIEQEEFMDVIAIAESTPGPIAVNVATFVGSSQAGVLGALCATLGVVLPSFFIILLIAAILRNLLKFAGVQAVLGGIRPCIVGMVLGTGLTMLLSTVLGFSSFGKGMSFDWRALVILFLLAGAFFAFKKWKKHEPSPIVLILFAAACGMGLYAIPM